MIIIWHEYGRRGVACFLWGIAEEETLTSHVEVSRNRIFFIEGGSSSTQFCITRSCFLVVDVQMCPIEVVDIGYDDDDDYYYDDDNDNYFNTSG